MALPQTDTSLQPSQRRFLFLLVGLQLLLAVVVVIGTLVGLRDMRNDALAANLRQTSLLVRGFEDHFSQNIYLVSLMLTNLPDLLATPHMERKDVPGSLLESIQRQMPALRSLSIADADGRILASSSPANVGIKVDSSSFVPNMKEQREGLMRFGVPRAGRDFHGSRETDPAAPVGAHEIYFLPVMQSLPGPRKLTAIAAINPDYFQNHISGHVDGDQIDVSILNYEGVNVVTTEHGPRPGSQIGDHRLLESVRVLEIGEMPNEDAPEEIANTVFRSSRQYPFFVLAHINRDAVLENWREVAAARIWMVSFALVMTLLVTGLLTLRLRKLFKRDLVLQEAQQLAASVFTHAREGIAITDGRANIIDVNQAFTDITGYSREDVLGQNPRILSSGRQDKNFYEAMWRELQTMDYWSGEIWNRRKDGSVYSEILTISAVRDQSGEIRNFIALFYDITTIKQYQLQLEHIAHYDALTELPNRLLLADRLRQGMSQAIRRDQRLVVVYLDLDGFKAVNDTHSHSMGDYLLRTLARRMTQALRSGDTLARIGGDEFVAVLLDLPEIEASIPILTRLLETAEKPVTIGDSILKVSASLGVSFYPQGDEVDADQLIRQADQAMYQAKQTGKNCYQFFDPEHDRSVRGHHERIQQIRGALDKGEFVLHYQPKVKLRSGEIIGTEALIRWQHPQQGILPPAAFLPIIEDHPYAIELGEWVIDTALAQIEAWNETGLALPISVNIDAMQLQHPDFVSRLRALLEKHPRVIHGQLELEILETSALDDIDGVSQIMRECLVLGVGFALDDFGTGYSSLLYLKQLRAELLKVDRSFVSGMLENPDDLAILEAVQGLATAFRCNVIAEGVETLAHGEMLLRIGYEMAQGFAIARPMPAQEFVQWMASWESPPSWKVITPIERDRLPALYASVEHRAWIANMLDYLEGRRDNPPEQDHHQCRFGYWLDHGGRNALLGEQANIHEVDALHLEVHRLAGELIALKQRGSLEVIPGRVGELLSVRDRLLEKLKGQY